MAEYVAQGAGQAGPLSFDCLAYICEYLSPEDLLCFSLVCQEFYHVSQLARLWRLHCKRRWLFCNLPQAQGGDKWRKYYISRRGLEKKMARGQPGRDYRVKSIRDHKSDVAKIIFLKGLEETSPVLISCDRTGILMAHSPREGKKLWEGKMSPNSLLLEQSDDGKLFFPSSDENLVSTIDTNSWALCEDIKLSPLRGSPESRITYLLHAEVENPSLPKPFLAVGRTSTDTAVDHSTIEVWDPSKAAAGGPVVRLDTGGLVPTRGCLSSTGILAMAAGNYYSTDIKVWDLKTIVIDGGDVCAHVVIHLGKDVAEMCWWTGRCGVLAVQSVGDGSVTVWELQPQLEQKQKMLRHRLSEPVSLMHHNYSWLVSCTVAGHTGKMVSARSCLLYTGSEGELNLLPYGAHQSPITYKDHRGPITGIAASGFVVLTCSEDYSIRVYQWCSPETADGSKPLALNSCYTLLGGSLQMAANSGFSGLANTLSACAAYCGATIKVYMFEQ